MAVYMKGIGGITYGMERVTFTANKRRGNVGTLIM